MNWERETEGPRAGMFKRFEFDRKAANVRQTPTPYQTTRTGYGAKLPTGWKVQLPDSTRWYRVYCAIYSSSGTCYICHHGKQTIVEIW